MKTIGKQLAFGVLIFLPFVFMDYMWVRNGQKENCTWANQWIHLILLGAVPLGFFMFNYKWAQRLRVELRIVVPLLMSVLITAIWCLVAITIYMNFHLAIGGTK